MITLSVVVWVIWTAARFQNRYCNNWTRFGYNQYGAWYAHLWDIVHLVAIIGGVSWFIIKHFN